MKDGLVDLDIIVYVVGSVTDGRHYMYKGQRWDSKKELNRTLKDDDVDPMSIKVQKDPTSWNACKKILLKTTEGIFEKLGTLDNKGFLTGSGNFRYDIATILPYKGNRVALEKPHHYDAIRQLLVDAYDAKLSSEKEADDEVGLAHTVGETIVASTDKDLDCIPGDHYNWDRDEHYYVTTLQADHNFYCQLLTGDTTDNIPGLYGVGKGSALVKQVRAMEDTREMDELVITQYRKRFGSYAEQFLMENAQLLWILQQRPMPLSIQV